MCFRCVCVDGIEYCDELTVIDGIVFTGLSVVPKSLQREMLEIIHEGNLATDKCKRGPRTVQYWVNDRTFHEQETVYMPLRNRQYTATCQKIHNIKQSSTEIQYQFVVTVAE